MLHQTHATLTDLIGMRPACFQQVSRRVLSGVRHCIKEETCNSGQNSPTVIRPCKGTSLQEEVGNTTSAHKTNYGSLRRTIGGCHASIRLVLCLSMSNGGKAWLIKELSSADLPFRTVDDGPLAGPELTESTERGMCWSQGIL